MAGGRVGRLPVINITSPEGRRQTAMETGRQESTSECLKRKERSLPMCERRAGKRCFSLRMLDLLVGVGVGVVVESAGRAKTSCWTRCSDAVEMLLCSRSSFLSREQRYHRWSSAKSSTPDWQYGGVAMFLPVATRGSAAKNTLRPKKLIFLISKG